MSSVALRLRGQLSVEALLPQVSSDRLDLIRAVLVAQMSAVGGAFRSHTETPERRHLCSRTECLWVLEPDRQPLFAQLDANVLEVWSNLLHVLHLILRLQVHL